MSEIIGSLQVFEGKTATVKEIWPLHAGVNKVGRAEDNDVPLMFKCVSRTHAILEEKDGNWTIRDDGSSLRTRFCEREGVLGSMIKQRVSHELNDNQIINFGGDCRCKFSKGKFPDHLYTQRENNDDEVDDLLKDDEEEEPKKKETKKPLESSGTEADLREAIEEVKDEPKSEEPEEKEKEEEEEEEKKVED